MDYNYERFDVPLFCDSQKTKDCKKITPDFVDSNEKKGIPQMGFQAKDIVYLKSTSLVNKKLIEGDFIFDSYDKYDNTCYVLDKGGMTWNVLIGDLVLIEGKKK